MRKSRRLVLRIVLSLLVPLSFSYVTEAQSSQEAPAYKITPEVSRIKFNVKASIPLEGTFEKWDAALAFTSTDASTGSLDLKIQADSLNTGSKAKKDKKLKGKQCLDAKNHPSITFRSTKIMQKGPHTFDVPGTFSVRGISKPETLTFTADREGEGTGEIEGVLWFERADFGFGGNVPFVRISTAWRSQLSSRQHASAGPLCCLSNNRELFRAKLRSPFLGWAVHNLRKSA